MYYFYDEQTQSYQFHSKVDLPEVVVTGTKGSRSQSDRKRQERERQKGERSRKGRNPDQSREEVRLDGVFEDILDGVFEKYFMKGTLLF